MKQTREDWLLRAVEDMTANLFGNYQVPENIRVSCGLPSRGAFARKKRRVGECWSAESTKDKHFEIYISPTQGDVVRVLETLAHEVVHAIAGLECGHKGAFKRIALSVGFLPPMTSTPSNDELKAYLSDLAGKLGPYPHGELMKVSNGRKKQGTRMLKVICPECGYTVRTTAKWLDVGVPSCVCGMQMEVAA